MDVLAKMLAAALDGPGQLSSVEGWLAIGALAYAGMLFVAVLWATRTFEPPENDTAAPARGAGNRRPGTLFRSGRGGVARA